LSSAATALVAFVALEHLAFLVLEMFLWNTPVGMRVFGLEPAFAEASASLAANQGLYNGFLAAGLVWSLVRRGDCFALQVFFLSCVVVAGVFGAVTAKGSILLVQAAPALVALGLVVRSRGVSGLSEIARNWGTTAEERSAPFPCDALLSEANAVYFRGVSVQADPSVVFRWLCQLRAAPYSYDWIDNGGRRSPRELTPGLETLAVGQPFMRIFELAAFEPDRHVTLRLRRPGLFPPLVVSYVVAPCAPYGSRLLVKLALRYRPGLLDRLSAALLPWGDWIMMRRQLLNLKALAESMRG
jgi:uncharacterized membrane protein